MKKEAYKYRLSHVINKNRLHIYCNYLFYVSVVKNPFFFSVSFLTKKLK